MIILPGLIIGSSRPSVTYNGYKENPAVGTSTDTLTGAPLGTASADRFVVAALAFEKLAAASESVTIAGQSAPLIAGTKENYASSALFVGMYGVLLPTGTTGDIVMTVSSATVSLYFAAMYSLYRLRSTTPVDVAVSDANPMALSVNTLTASIAIGLAFVNNATTVSWSGLTEDVDIQDSTGAPGNTYSAASVSLAPAATPRVITATPVAPTPQVGCAAVFR